MSKSPLIRRQRLQKLAQRYTPNCSDGADYENHIDKLISTARQGDRVKKLRGALMVLKNRDKLERTKLSRLDNKRTGNSFNSRRPACLAGVSKPRYHLRQP